MNAAARWTVGALVFLAGGCTTNNTLPPGTYVVASPGQTVDPSFDRSWAAVIGAFEDEGVKVIAQDRNTGVVRGTREGIDVRSSVVRQSDGSLRIQFDSTGRTDRDPGLNSRITAAYNRRMGR
jgi:hypothetical protein